MQVFIWLLRLVVFLLLLCFSAMNSETVVLHYSHERSIEMPLNVALLIFFVLGAVLTMVAVLGSRRKE